jgi:hypothetical protein
VICDVIDADIDVDSGTECVMDFVTDDITDDAIDDFPDDITDDVLEVVTDAVIDDATDGVTDGVTLMDGIVCPPVIADKTAVCLFDNLSDINQRSHSTKTQLTMILISNYLLQKRLH